MTACIRGDASPAAWPVPSPIEMALRSRCERFDALRQFYNREDFGAPRWPLAGWLRAVNAPRRRFAHERMRQDVEDRRQAWWRGRRARPRLRFKKSR